MIVVKSCRPSRLDEEARKKLLTSLHAVTAKAWSEFSLDFLDRHVLRTTERLTLAYDGEKLIGFCAVGRKKINNKTIHYIEFTIVDPDHQRSRLGTRLVVKALEAIFVANFFRSFELMFISPNIRVLTLLAKYADWLYPNPYTADAETGAIAPADDQTWQLAGKLIAQSDDPSRRLDREGLVLHGSYRDTPWLLYEGEKVPWHHNEVVNRFAKRYLKYGEKEDKEFVIRARLSWQSLWRYWTKK